MTKDHIVIQKMKVRLHTDSYKSAISLKENTRDFLTNMVIKIIEDYILQYESKEGINQSMTILNQVKLNFSVSELNLNSTFSIDTWRNEIRNQLDVYFRTNKRRDREFNQIDNTVRFSEDEIRQKAFLSFLQDGILPWYCSESLGKDLLIKSNIELLFTENRNDFIKRFIELGNSVSVRRRIIYQLDTDLVLWIFSILVNRTVINRDSISLNQPFFNWLTQTEKREVLLKLFEGWYKSNADTAMQRILEWIIAPLNLGETKQTMLQKIEQLLSNSNELALEEMEVSTIQNDLREETNLNNERRIWNAGLILVHPFLKTFFDRLGLLTADSKLDNPELCVHLLHYLATGNECAFEHQMGFEKLLCGIPQQVPIERFVFLTEEMKEEARTLLNAVLANWTILSSSGIELLQNEFLVREGKVNEDEKNIHISFERKTQDILVDRIEWTLNYIKLPWLDKIIRVNW